MTPENGSRSLRESLLHTGLGDAQFALQRRIVVSHQASLRQLHARRLDDVQMGDGEFVIAVSPVLRRRPPANPSDGSCRSLLPAARRRRAAIRDSSPSAAGRKPAPLCRPLPPHREVGGKSSARRTGRSRRCRGPRRQTAAESGTVSPGAGRETPHSGGRAQARRGAESASELAVETVIFNELTTVAVGGRSWPSAEQIQSGLTPGDG